MAAGPGDGAIEEVSPLIAGAGGRPMSDDEDEGEGSLGPLGGGVTEGEMMVPSQGLPGEDALVDTGRQGQGQLAAHGPRGGDQAQLLQRYLQGFSDLEDRWRGQGDQEAVKEDLERFVNFVHESLVSGLTDAQGRVTATPEACERLLGVQNEPIGGHGGGDGGGSGSGSGGDGSDGGAGTGAGVANEASPLDKAFYQFSGMLIRVQLLLELTDLVGQLGRVHAHSMRLVVVARNMASAGLELQAAVDRSAQCTLPPPSPLGLDAVAVADMETLQAKLKRQLQAAAQVRAFLGNRFFTEGLGRRGKEVYRQRVVRGVQTRTWEAVGTVEEYLYKTLALTPSGAVHTLVSGQVGVSATVNWFENSFDPMLRELRDEDMSGNFSFRNGMVSTSSEPPRFWAWDDPTLPKDMWAQAYFDQDVDPDDLLVDDPMTIDTQGMDSVLLYQISMDVKATPSPEDLAACGDDHRARARVVARSKLGNSLEVLEWIYALFGRLLQPLRRFDHWEVMPILLGRAGTGKSTILDAIVSMFPPEGVARLSARADRFSVEPLVDAMVWVCSEMGERMDLDQSVLFSMVTGEGLMVRPFHGPWRRVTAFKTPGIMCGNKFPRAWGSSEGAMARRTILINFGRTVTEANTELPRVIRKQMPAFIVKIARLYYSMRKHVGSHGLWGTMPVRDADGEPVVDPDTGAPVRANVLPPYFHEQRMQLGKKMDPLQAFIADAQLVRSDSCRSAIKLLNQGQLGRGKVVSIPESRREQVFAYMTFAMPLQAFRELFQASLDGGGGGGGGGGRDGYKWDTTRAAHQLLQAGYFLFTPPTPMTYKGQPAGGTWVAGMTEASALVDSSLDAGGLNLSRNGVAVQVGQEADAQADDDFGLEAEAEAEAEAFGAMAERPPAQRARLGQDQGRQQQQRQQQKETDRMPLADPFAKSGSEVGGHGGEVGGHGGDDDDDDDEMALLRDADELAFE